MEEYGGNNSSSVWPFVTSHRESVLTFRPLQKNGNVTSTNNKPDAVADPGNMEDVSHKLKAMLNVSEGRSPKNSVETFFEAAASAITRSQVPVSNRQRLQEIVAGKCPGSSPEYTFQDDFTRGEIFATINLPWGVSLRAPTSSVTQAGAAEICAAEALAYIDVNGISPPTRGVADQGGLENMGQSFIPMQVSRKIVTKKVENPSTFTPKRRNWNHTGEHQYKQQNQKRPQRQKQKQHPSNVVRNEGPGGAPRDQQQEHARHKTSQQRKVFPKKTRLAANFHAAPKDVP